ncbi:MAG: hypothetical protein ACMG6E_02375 [Candidatus Roizmanbacteria bacterium]
MMFKKMSRVPTPPKQKEKGYSQPAFITMLVFTIIVGIIIIILIILLLRKNATLIKVTDCPTCISGIRVKPGSRITTNAANCGANASCIYTVSSLAAADTICRDLGPSKCAAFSLEQQTLSNNYTMTVSSSMSTSNVANVDTYFSN